MYATIIKVGVEETSAFLCFGTAAELIDFLTFFYRLFYLILNCRGYILMNVQIVIQFPSLRAFPTYSPMSSWTCAAL